MRRRDVLLGAMALALAAKSPGSALGQTRERPLRLGYIAATRNQRLYAAFLRGLRELGHIEGVNLTVLDRFADGRPDIMPERMADLIRATPDMIVASGNLATRAAQSETKTIPIVFAPVGDAIRNGYTSSLARPDKNLTGFSLDTHVLNQKRIEALRDYFPSVRRVAVLVNSANPSADGQWELTRMAALAFGLEPELISAYARELDGAFAAIAALEPDALHVVTDAIFDTERERIVAFAAERRLPSIYEHRAFTESGGLISYGPNLDHMSARAATYVDRIARGVPIRDIPVETPINLELVVNLKTAKALGIAISADLLARADEVIE